MRLRLQPVVVCSAIILQGGGGGSGQSNPTWGFPKISGIFFVGPNIKDYSTGGSILGSPNFGKLPLITGYNLNTTQS